MGSVRKKTKAERFFSMKAACTNCPFTKSEAAVKLGQERRVEIANSLEDGYTFSCHKTVDYDSGEEPGLDNSKMCFGAAAVLHRGGHPPVQMERIVSRLGMFDRDYEALESANTYESLQDFTDNALSEYEQ